RDTIKYRVNSHTAQSLLLSEGNSELLVSLQQFRVNFIKTLGSILGGSRGRVVNNVLIVNGWIVHICPSRFFHGQPMPVRLESPLKHKFRLLFLCRNHTNDVFIQTAGEYIGFYVRHESIFVLYVGELLNRRSLSTHVPFLLKLPYLFRNCDTHKAGFVAVA